MSNFIIRFTLQSIPALFIPLMVWSSPSQAIPLSLDQCDLCATGDVTLASSRPAILNPFRDINSTDGFTGNNGSAINVQSPYLIRARSGAALSDHLGYYYYGIYDEKGNHITVNKDAWLHRNNIFGTGINTQFGQFQVSDMMFPRDTRLSIQDFMAYRFAGLTYQRGVMFDRPAGPLKLSIGAVDGNGDDSGNPLEMNYNLSNPSYTRPDSIFGNPNKKDFFGRIGCDDCPVSVGLFGLNGKQSSIDTVNDPLGQTSGNRETEKSVRGIDLSGDLPGNMHWFAQALWTRWNNFIDSDPSRDFTWFGSFAGVNVVQSPRLSYSLLYNYDNARDLNDSGTIFEGINMKTITLTTSFYSTDNSRGIIEVNGDLQKVDPNNPVGHTTKEDYILLGFNTLF